MKEENKTLDFYSKKDVGELYSLINDITPKQLEIIKDTGLILGHFGLVSRAYEVMKEKGLKNSVMKREELVTGLVNAIINNRGFCIDDIDTSVGAFYQNLFGRDFEKTKVVIEMPSGKKEFGYLQLNEKQKDEINKRILYKKLGYLKINKETSKKN